MAQHIEAPDHVAVRIMAADVVMRRWTGDSLEVLMIERANEPRGKLVFPGGHQEPEKDQDNKDTARRETFEEVFFVAARNRLKFLYFLDANPNDTRPGPPRVSVVYEIDAEPDECMGVRPGDGVVAVYWKRLDDIQEDEVGFDHFKIIRHLRAMYC